MDGDIVGHVGHLMGVLVVDDDGHEHEISIDDRTGAVAIHTTDAYSADLDERTRTETELLRQAQRYAKHVFASRMDRESYPPGDRPDRIEAVRKAIEGMDAEAFEERFGTYRAQVASHHADTERPHSLPPAVGDGDSVLYRLAVYLDEDDETVEQVSGVEVVYWAPRDERRSQVHDAPPDRVPDAHLELGPGDLSPDDVADGDAFRAALLDHLSCQVRDYYVGMGEAPPAAYRVTGPGKSEYTARYRTLDLYPDYHDRSAEPFD